MCIVYDVLINTFLRPSKLCRHSSSCLARVYTCLVTSYIFFYIFPSCDCFDNFQRVVRVVRVEDLRISLIENFLIIL